MAPTPGQRNGTVGRASSPALSLSSVASSSSLRSRAAFAKRTNIPSTYSFSSGFRSASSVSASPSSDTDTGDYSSFWDNLVIQLGVAKDVDDVKKIRAELMSHYQTHFSKLAQRVHAQRSESLAKAQERWSQREGSQATQASTQSGPGDFSNVPINKHYRWELRERQKW